MEALFPELIWLVCIAFMAGMVDAAVGGGGLVQLPGLFTVLPQHAPAALLGTRIALRGGTPVIRKLFLVLVVVLIAKMGWDTVAG